jgi:hypothetical protein
MSQYLRATTAIGIALITASIAAPSWAGDILISPRAPFGGASGDYSLDISNGSVTTSSGAPFGFIILPKKNNTLSMSVASRPGKRASFECGLARVGAKDAKVAVDLRAPGSNGAGGLEVVGAAYTLKVEPLDPSSSTAPTTLILTSKSTRPLKFQYCVVTFL